jgi:hypothetical protein
MHKEWLKGWVVGNLIMIAALFVYGQYQFGANQKVFYIGTIDGAWTDSQPATPHAKMTMR